MGFVSRGIDGAFGAEQCSCEWTLFWACPDWGNVGINGRAEDDGSPCFHHCCDTPSPTDDPDTLPWSPDDGFKPGDLGGWTDPGFGSFEPGVNGLERPNLPLSKSCSCSWTQSAWHLAKRRAPAKRNDAERRIDTAHTETLRIEASPSLSRTTVAMCSFTCGKSVCVVAGSSAFSPNSENLRP